MKYLYDTNIFIDYLAEEPAILQFFSKSFLSKNEVIISCIVRIELLSFPELSNEEEAVITDLLMQKATLKQAFSPNSVKISLYPQPHQTMNPTQYQLSLSFEQVLNLVKQLPEAEKLKLSEALSKELLDSKLTHLLEAFKTDELCLEDITQEVESVRTESGEDDLYPSRFFLPIASSNPKTSGMRSRPIPIQKNIDILKIIDRKSVALIHIATF